MQQEARDIIQQPKAWKTFDSQEGCEQNFVQGPHLYYNGTIWQIVRIHGDSSGSFLTAHSHLARRAASEKSSAIFQTLKFLGTRYQTFGIAVPARALRADLRTLQGLRFAVKHTYRLRGTQDVALQYWLSKYKPALRHHSYGRTEYASCRGLCPWCNQV